MDKFCHLRLEKRDPQTSGFPFYVSLTPPNQVPSKNTSHPHTAPDSERPTHPAQRFARNARLALLRELQEPPPRLELWIGSLHSKDRVTNEYARGTLVNGTLKTKTWCPGGLILTHTHLGVCFSLRAPFLSVV